MDARITPAQYRALAEGLLKSAIKAQEDQAKELLEEALRYLAHARLQENQQRSGAETEPELPEDVEPQLRQIRQLIKKSLEMPTPEEFVEALDFTTTFRRLSVWNAHMARIQRPGAKVIATQHEWQREKRYVLPDAVPIMILWPFSPIKYVYEIADTGPPLEQDPERDPFAVEGNFRPACLSKLMASLRKQRHFKVKIEARRQGRDKAGSAAGQGVLWNLETAAIISHLAEQNASTQSEIVKQVIPVFRITINDRLEPAEQFVTLAHELAHIFCGHLGPCASRRGVKNEEESGWPDRHKLGKHEKEVEAEAAAFLVASRAALFAKSANYLASYVRQADPRQVDMELVVRAAARIERFAGIRYGTMEF
jgi:Zn-dependent peptidase ImmA (M78 family)